MTKPTAVEAIIEAGVEAYSGDSGVSQQELREYLNALAVAAAGPWREALRDLLETEGKSLNEYEVMASRDAHRKARALLKNDATEADLD